MLLINKLIFLILIHLNSLKSNDIDVNKHCLIHNLKYSHEYLYTSKKKNARKNSLAKIMTTPLSKVDDFNKITWMFLPVESNQIQMNFFHNNNMNINRSTYLIKSGKYENEYLCATNQFERISLNSRLLIKLSKIKVGFDQIINYNCYWMLEKVYLKKTIDGFKESETAFVIRNILVNEPLYAASFIFNSGWYKRSVFLWSAKGSVISDEFIWIVDCSKGEFLFLK